jgi:polyisoprenyl-teichoic acid--peptidoglycan teichoic acid transferase
MIKNAIMKSWIMNNLYRQRQKKKGTKADTLDGFLPNYGSLGDRGSLHKQFRKSYSPPKDSASEVRNIDAISSKEEGFHSMNKSFSEVSQRNRKTSSFDLSLEDHSKKKRSFFRRRKTNKNRSMRHRVLRGFAVSFLALILAVGSLFAYGYIKTRQVFRGNGEGAAALQKNVDPARLNGEGDGRINILLLGKGGPGHVAPDLTDTLLLVSIDPIQNEAALLSIPRDLYVKDQNQYSMKINAVYANAKQSRLNKSNKNAADENAAEDAGLRALKQTVSEVIGVPVHYYVMVNFKAFEDAINTVGGLTIDVKKPLYDQSVAWQLGGNPLIADKGLQTFDGRRALFYARSRMGSTRGDFDRTERQREIVVALQNEILSTGTFSNPIKIIELLNTFGNNVRTDLNGVDEIKRLYEIGRNIGSDRIISVELADDPVLVATDFINNQSVVVPLAGLYQYEEIQSFVRNKLRDAFLKQEDARIVILNGSKKAGLATLKEKELKSYGYNVVLVENALNDNFTTTKLIDLSSGQKRYTQSYLERRLGVRAETTLIEGLPTIENADFVIVLGNDEAIKTN